VALRHARHLPDQILSEHKARGQPLPSTDMDQSPRDDPKLREVKAVLHHLQGLPSADLPPAEPEPPLRGRRLGMTGILIVVVLAVAVLGLAAIPGVRQFATLARRDAAVTSGPEVAAKVASDPGSPNSTTVAKANARADAEQARQNASVPSTTAAVEAAVTLMNSGQVQAARKRLLALADGGSPDVLWALARSFDPTVLAQIPAADAAPDVTEGERWYRAWHAAAVRQGLVSDTGSSLEKIIGSMRRR
jgi:hypothetical protein